MGTNPNLRNRGVPKVPHKVADDRCFFKIVVGVIKIVLIEQALGLYTIWTVFLAN
jgi:hypothetical protein